MENVLSALKNQKNKPNYWGKSQGISAKHIANETGPGDVHSLNRLETLSSLQPCAPTGFPALSSHPSPASRRPSPATAFRRPVPPRTQTGVDLALWNVHPFHLFADASKDYIHIKSQQRNIGKSLTTLQAIKGSLVIYDKKETSEGIEEEICQQWYCNWASRRRRSDSATGWPEQEHMPVPPRDWTGKGQPAEASWV